MEDGWAGNGEGEKNWYVEGPVAAAGRTAADGVFAPHCGDVLPGMPFAPTHLDAMLDLVFQAMTASRDDLALRLRAKVA